MWKKINDVPNTESTSAFKDMRYFVYYSPKNSMRSTDVGESVLVEDILTLIKKEFGLNIEDSSSGEISIVLSYNGSDLKPKWSLTDLSIPSGSILRCLYREEIAADLYIHCSYNKQIFKLFDSSITIDTTIGMVRKIISSRLGLPLSVFCLETYNGQQRLYDQMRLIDYDLKIHGHMYLKVWRGYEKFINACIKGFTEQFSHDELTRHYQTQIALYIAAFYSHMELANSVLQQGARSDRPVGEHPSRQWSSRSTQEILPEILICPIHIAVERGHVNMVDLFVRQSILCTQIRHPVTGSLPYALALACHMTAIVKQDKQRYRVIYYYLQDKQYNLKIPLNSTGEYVSNLLTSTISASAIHHTSKHLVCVSLPFYCKIISWYERARENAWKKYGGTFYTPTQTKRVYPKQGLLGYKVLIDGYNNTFDVPEEQLRRVRSSDSNSKGNDLHRYVGLSAEEREKLIKSKLLMKDLALDERKRAKQIAAANLQQSRRPPLLSSLKAPNSNKKASLVSDSIYSSSYISNSPKRPSSILPDSKAFESISENDISAVNDMTSSTLSNISTIIRRIEDEQKLDDNFKRSSKPLYKRLPSIPSVTSNEEEKHALPTISTATSNIPLSYPSLTKKLDTSMTTKMKDNQTIMPSADAYALLSLRSNLEAEQRQAAKRRELFMEIKQSVENQPDPQPQKPPTLLPVPLPVERASIDIDTHIVLPEHPTVRRLNPIKSHIDVNVRQSTVQPYERYASASTRSTAVRCLQEAAYFKRKSWIKQVEISKEMVKNHVKRRMRRADREIPNKARLLPLCPSAVTSSTH